MRIINQVPGGNQLAEKSYGLHRPAQSASRRPEHQRTLGGFAPNLLNINQLARAGYERFNVLKYEAEISKANNELKLPQPKAGAGPTAPGGGDKATCIKTFRPRVRAWKIVSSNLPQS